MTRLIPLGALIGLAIATQVQAQQAPPAQNTQAPTSQNSPTSIGPDPFRAHDANVSPRERAEEGAKTEPAQGAAGAEGSRMGNDGRLQGHCATGKDGQAMTAQQREACMAKPSTGAKPPATK